MTTTSAARPYDLVVLGATGFTGKLVAEYLVTNYGAHPSHFKWAIAGRSPTKVQSVAAQLKVTELPCLTADNDDLDSLNKLAKQSKVIITTVGPYHVHGSKLVEACAAAGTHLVDLTGESLWVHEMIEKHHATAAASGAKIIPSGGFDSIPADVGTYLVCEHLRRVHSCGAAAVTYYCGKMSATGVSGGTIASIKGVAEACWGGGRSVVAKLADPYLLVPADRRPDYKNPGDGGGFGYDSEIAGWTGPFIFAGHDSKLVHRSNALLNGLYGRLHYREVMPFKGRLLGLLPAAVSTVATGIASLLFFVPLTRGLLLRLLPAQGQGPPREKMDKGFFWINLVGKGENGVKVTATVGTDKGDCGYKGTAIMLAETGLTLALAEPDTLPVQGGGVLTTASLGMPLIERLRHAGITCSVQDAGSSSSSGSVKQD